MSNSQSGHVLNLFISSKEIESLKAGDQWMCSSGLGGSFDIELSEKKDNSFVFRILTNGFIDTRTYKTSDLDSTIYKRAFIPLKMGYCLVGEFVDCSSWESFMDIVGLHKSPPPLGLIEWLHRYYLKFSSNFSNIRREDVLNALAAQESYQ